MAPPPIYSPPPLPAPLPPPGRGPRAPHPVTPEMRDTLAGRVLPALVNAAFGAMEGTPSDVLNAIQASADRLAAVAYVLANATLARRRRNKEEYHEQQRRLGIEPGGSGDDYGNR